MAKVLSLIARLLLAAAGMAYIVLSITWSDQLGPAGEVVNPGIVTVLATARWQWLVVGFLCVAAMFPAQALRWHLLMRARAMDVTFGRALKLTLVGTFFNFCMPGTTGGDVVKAYYAAKRSDRRADAVMAVIFDRITGMLGLIVLSGIMGLFMLGHESVRMVTLAIWALAACIAIVAGLYFSPTVRRHLRVEAVVARLPGGSWIRALDAAAFAYGAHRGAVRLAIVLSALSHLILATATALAGYALGMEVPLGVMLTVIPVVFLLGAAPLTYQGLGLMEWLAKLLLLGAGLATANQIIAMLLIARLYQVVMGLVGAMLMLKGDIHLHPIRQLQDTALALVPSEQRGQVSPAKDVKPP